MGSQCAGLRSRQWTQARAIRYGLPCRENRTIPRIDGAGITCHRRSDRHAAAKYLDASGTDQSIKTCAIRAATLQADRCRWADAAFVIILRLRGASRATRFTPFKHYQICAMR